MIINTTAISTFEPLEPSALEKLNSKINNVSNRISSITPYEESKTAYIGDTECVFTKAKEGMINANCITESGLSISVTMEITNTDIIVKFDELEEMATVNISIQ